jgi:hypothetical protein
MRHGATTSIVCAALVASAIPGAVATAQEKPKGKTVRVDCSRRGASIAKALSSPADELVIEITGFCRENVEIRRSDVTLRGASGDATLDGIEGVSASPWALAVVEVWNADRVTFEDLTLRGGRAGLATFGAQRLAIERCNIDDNLVTGATFGAGSSAMASLSTFSRNRNGVTAVGGSFFSCSGCTADDNSQYGVTATEGAEVSFGGYYGDPSSGDPPIPGHIAGGHGALAMDGGIVTVRDGEIDIDTTLDPTLPAAAFAARGGSVTLTSVSFNSIVFTDRIGTIMLEGATQTSLPAGLSNQIRDHSYFRVRGSVVNGPTELWEFSKAIFYCSDTVLAGDLSCHFGGDAMAGSEITVTGTVSDCPSWIP